MVKLITTDSYFNLFNILAEELSCSAKGLDGKNVVFCEEKVSLMAERFLCAKIGGSFNTDVYSFGNYLRKNKTIDKLLSKEGSAMAIKRIISSIKLNCFKDSKTGLAPSLFELIIQLKSAKVTPEDIVYASENTSGVLKNKLSDIALVYLEYEKFIKEGGYDDQSSALSYLPDLIKNSDLLSGANVYLFGFASWTAQIRASVSALIEKAASVTAILPEGRNPLVYVNETAQFIREVCTTKGISIREKKVDGDFSKEGRIIADNIFNPSAIKRGKFNTEKIAFNAAKNASDEIMHVAEIIKWTVMNEGCRYRDFTVAVPDVNGYEDHIKTAFELLGVPYFLDEKKKTEFHPLITLILSYIDVFRKNFEISAVRSFIKNPLFCEDKALTDAFENYIIKHNVNYGRIKLPFTFQDENLEEIEKLRQSFCSNFNRFDVRELLNNLAVEGKLLIFSQRLADAGEQEEAAVTQQIFSSVSGILNEMQMMLSGVELSLYEYKNIFMSGVSALELSIIPQYNDAVFIGGYKETALGKAKYLFVPGLTSDVPDVREDVALLSDGDIGVLENIKIMVEPKIKVVNHRTRENVALALSAFSDRLFLSYPIASSSGKKTVKSEIVYYLEKMFTLSGFPERQDYLTKKQGLYSFAKSCGEFADGKCSDFESASSFYKVDDSKRAERLVEMVNKEVKLRLDDNRSVISAGETSPTTIEDYYKCPYLAFVLHALNLKPREEGKVDGLSVGNIMHEIFCEFAENIDKIKDKESAFNLFEQIKEKTLAKDRYNRFLFDSATSAALDMVLRESKEYCYRTYLSFVNSDFKVYGAERAFGEGKEFPAISLLGGKVKLKGKIDRVDVSDKYFRVVDYKTGNVDSSDKLLFAGIKLQLYLYAAAVEKKFSGQKSVAGAYYLGVSDKFEKIEDKERPLADGKTLGEKDALSAQDNKIFEDGKSCFLPVTVDEEKLKNTIGEEAFNAYVKYAVIAAKSAATQMDEGVIVPSPFKGSCRFCEYKALCGQSEPTERTVKTVKENILTETVARTEGGEK